MANYMENQLTIRGTGGVLACLDAIKGEPDQHGLRHIAFERIVPIPAILQTESTSRFRQGRVVLGDDVLGQAMLSEYWVKNAGITDLAGLRKHLLEECPGIEEAGRRSIQAHQETGCWDRREWYIARWGTERNAFFSSLLDEVSDSRADIRFCTVWYPPCPVVIELSKQFPALVFSLSYWESGLGECGILRVRAGIVLRDATYEYDAYDENNEYDVIQWDDIKRSVPREAAAFERQLEAVGIGRNEFCRSWRRDDWNVAPDKGDSIDRLIDAWSTLDGAFTRATTAGFAGLKLEPECHASDDQDVVGFFSVHGAYQVTPAGAVYDDIIERRQFPSASALQEQLD